jgi:thiamine-phosphate pyrophosphorylase
VYVVDLEEAARGERVDRVLDAGVTCLWLRAPGATGRALYDAAGSLLLRCRRMDAALLVGDRADVALAVGADGVQIGARSPPADRVRPWYRGWLGVSCHGAAELEAAAAAGADHATLSPVYGVPEKGKPLGPERLRALVRGTSLPVVALGGVDPGNVSEALGAGARGVAVIRAIRDAADPAAAVRGLLGVVTTP